MATNQKDVHCWVERFEYQI